MHSHSSNDCDTAVIGAGPYGLAVAAHLKAAGVATRVFGEPLAFWQRQMPAGMLLRSPRGATDIPDPQGAHSLARFAASHAGADGEQLPRNVFVAYGTWFQERAVPDVDRRKVAEVEAAEEGFRLHIADGSALTARRVVVAMGLANQQVVPEPFATIPAELASHACEHADLARFRGKRVVVVGRGQSACESAALLSEAGAEVQIVSRGPIRWLGVRDPAAGWRKRLRGGVADVLGAPSAVGPFPYSWLVEAPALVHALPAAARARFNARCLGAGAAGWLKPRFGAVRVTAGRTILTAVPNRDKVDIGLDDGTTVRADHVLLATGYRTDIARMGVLAPGLLAGIACRGGSPILGAGLEFSVPGLHFAGAAAVASYGPLLRFIAGTGFAARTIARALAGAPAVQRAGMPSSGHDALASSLAAGPT